MASSKGKGNPRVIIRIEPDLLNLIEGELQRSRQHRKGQSHNLSTWIRQACIDRLKHSARSRGVSAADLVDLSAFPDEGV